MRVSANHWGSLPSISISEKHIDLSTLSIKTDSEINIPQFPPCTQLQYRSKDVDNHRFSAFFFYLFWILNPEPKILEFVPLSDNHICFLLTSCSRFYAPPLLWHSEHLSPRELNFTECRFSPGRTIFSHVPRFTQPRK